MAVGLAGAVTASLYKFIRDEGYYFSTVLEHPGHKEQAPYLGKHYLSKTTAEPSGKYWTVWNNQIYNRTQYDMRGYEVVLRQIMIMRYKQETQS